MINNEQQKLTGTFNTPSYFVSLAHDYMEKNIHGDIYSDYIWWDSSCGIGNLTKDYDIKKLYLSTLLQDDLDYIKRNNINNGATLFQYDFLNDTRQDLFLTQDEKLKSICPDLIENLKSKHCIFIANPPFLIQKTNIDNIGVGTDVTNTIEYGIMKEKDMIIPGRNYASQFMHRFLRIQKNYNTDLHIGLFCPIMFMTLRGYSKFRELWFENFEFKNGFVFSSHEFEDLKNNTPWPVSFTIWSSKKTDKKSNFSIELDIIENRKKNGTKIFKPPDCPLIDWVDSPSHDLHSFPLSNALGFGGRKTRPRHKINKNAIGYLAYVGNDVQNSRYSCIFSSSACHGMGWSIMDNNFIQSMLCLFARAITENNWLNNKDEYSIPNLDLNNLNKKDEEFIEKAVIWVLFNKDYNRSSSLSNMEYKNKIYNVKNNFFFMSPLEIQNIEKMPKIIKDSSINEKEPYISKWIRSQNFSDSVNELICLGKELVIKSAKYRLNKNIDSKYQLKQWDAGLFQIIYGIYENKKLSDKELDNIYNKFLDSLNNLEEELQPKLYEYEFLKEK